MWILSKMDVTMIKLIFMSVYRVSEICFMIILQVVKCAWRSQHPRYDDFCSWLSFTFVILWCFDCIITKLWTTYINILLWLIFDFNVGQWFTNSLNTIYCKPHFWSFVKLCNLIFWFDFVSINSTNQCFVSFFLSWIFIFLISKPWSYSKAPSHHSACISSRNCVYMPAWWLCQERSNSQYILTFKRKNLLTTTQRMMRKTTACLQWPRPFPLLD